MAIAEMAARGRARLAARAPAMKASWEAARPRAIAGFRAVGFGPTRVANFEKGIMAGEFRVDPDKWARNWAIKMAE